ncbi:substrate-binding domain-containing protein [Marinobacterium sedimentorum]|uniref:substrate-binding domain-containing protein n=1 Tax=Marinobacterium sedimentorum TaxID=2927804 RepID=UPI0020C62C2E|nr:substrate-binding domain-containing protein [Marinobacterium sedimentorum]MCP8686726.1 substrate-binding domain-containing protein [Marinobacterium sedimentorum]
MYANNKKITLKTLSEHLQVSTATISNAFNRPDQLSVDLRRHILDECRRMGYAGPNVGRRQFRARGRAMGLVLAAELAASLQDSDTQALIRGFAQVLDQHRYNLLLLPLDGNNLVELQHQALIDGLAFCGGAALPGESLPSLMAHRPLVALDFEHRGLGSIQVEHYAGARRAVRHGLAQGAGHAAILGLQLLDSSRVCRVEAQEAGAGPDTCYRQRLRGYLDGLDAMLSGLGSHRIWHLPDASLAAGIQAAREALCSQPRPELLLCMDDGIALAALRVAAELGLRVPEDVRIIGWRSAVADSYVSGMLTSIVQPSGEERGRLAAQMLFGGKAEQRRLATDLQIGASCP